MADIDPSISITYNPENHQTRVMAFDPHYNRGWQSAMFPTTPENVVVQKVSVSEASSGNWKYILQTAAGLIGVRMLNY